MVTRIFGHIAIDQLVASRSGKDTRDDIAEAQSNMAASSQPAFRQQGAQEVHVHASKTKRTVIIMNESEWNMEFGSRPTAKETKNIPKMEVSGEGGEGEETVFVFKWEPHLMHLRTHSISSKTEVRLIDKRLDPADHLYTRQAEQVRVVARSDAGIAALEALCAASLPRIT
ncbi:unnamed protein product, partial [Prorocentrum cordatum]